MNSKDLALMFCSHAGMMSKEGKQFWDGWQRVNKFLQCQLDSQELSTENMLKGSLKRTF